MFYFPLPAAEVVSFLLLKAFRKTHSQLMSSGFLNSNYINITLNKNIHVFYFCLWDGASRAGMLKKRKVFDLRFLLFGESY